MKGYFAHFLYLPWKFSSNNDRIFLSDDNGCVVGSEVEGPSGHLRDFLGLRLKNGPSLSEPVVPIEVGQWNVTLGEEKHKEEEKKTFKHLGRTCQWELQWEPWWALVNIGKQWKTLVNIGEHWWTLTNIGEHQRILVNSCKPLKTLVNICEHW